LQLFLLLTYFILLHFSIDAFQHQQLLQEDKAIVLSL